MKKGKRETDPMLPHGMRLSEFDKLTASRCGSSGFRNAVPPTKHEDGKGVVQVHSGRREQMVAEDKKSKTQKRKANRPTRGQGQYGKQSQHSRRRLTAGHRGKLGHSKRQIQRTCGFPFDKRLGFVNAPGQGAPNNIIK